MATPSDAAPERFGRYLLFGELARGGMGSVHLGALTGAGGFTKFLAIKRMHNVVDPGLRKAFLREARLAARIEHANVVTTIDAVEVEGEIVVAMEFVLGESLDRLLSRLAAAGAKVPPAIAVS